MRNLTGKKLVDRLPVIVVGAAVNQLLDVPKLTSSTGESQASVAARLTENCSLVDRIASMVLIALPVTQEIEMALVFCWNS